MILAVFIVTSALGPFVWLFVLAALGALLSWFISSVRVKRLLYAALCAALVAGLALRPDVPVSCGTCCDWFDPFWCSIFI